MRKLKSGLDFQTFKPPPMPPRRTSSQWRQQIEPPLMKKHFVSKWQQHPKRSRTSGIFFLGSCKVEMFGCGDLGDGDWLWRWLTNIMPEGSLVEVSLPQGPHFKKLLGFDNNNHQPRIMGTPPETNLATENGRQRKTFRPSCWGPTYFFQIFWWPGTPSKSNIDTKNEGF